MSVSSLNVGEGESGMDEKKDSRLTVLVVEAFEDNRFMMRRLLEMSGYGVVEPANGQQAVETARRERPAIILMDLSLPMLDGLAATRRIREQDGLSKVPIGTASAHQPADSHA